MKDTITPSETAKVREFEDTLRDANIAPDIVGLTALVVSYELTKQRAETAEAKVCELQAEIYARSMPLSSWRFECGHIVEQVEAGGDCPICQRITELEADKRKVQAEALRWFAEWVQTPPRIEHWTEQGVVEAVQAQAAAVERGEVEVNTSTKPCSEKG